jgi:hypothetical protein
MNQKTTNNRESEYTGFCCSERFSRAGKLAGRVHRFGITLSPLAGRQWIQMDNGQETRLPTGRKESTIESVPNEEMA